MKFENLYDKYGNQIIVGSKLGSGAEGDVYELKKIRLFSNLVAPC